jgi:hypothetical protein
VNIRLTPDEKLVLEAANRRRVRPGLVGVRPEAALAHALAR